MIGRDESFEYIWNRIIEINDKYKPQWKEWDIRTFGIGLSKEVGEICDDISVLVGGGTNEKPEPTMIEMIIETIDTFVYGVMFIQWLCRKYEYYGLIPYELFKSLFREKLNIVEQRLIKNMGEPT